MLATARLLDPGTAGVNVFEDKLGAVCVAVVVVEEMGVVPTRWRALQDNAHLAVLHVVVPRPRSRPHLLMCRWLHNVGVGVALCERPGSVDHVCIECVEHLLGSGCLEEKNSVKWPCGLANLD